MRYEHIIDGPAHLFMRQQMANVDVSPGERAAAPSHVTKIGTLSSQIPPPSSHLRKPYPKRLHDELRGKSLEDDGVVTFPETLLEREDGTTQESQVRESRASPTSVGTEQQ